MPKSSLVLSLALLLVACSDRGGPRGGGDGGPGSGSDGGMRGLRDGCVPADEVSVETCSDGLDNDCDYLYDCSDPTCSGVGECPLCGTVDTPLGSPLALPDGIGDISCANDGDCPGEQHCFTIEGFAGPMMECRESYRSTLSFIGFGSATFDSVNDITSLCVTMEHSWIRDLEITLEAPNGASVRLQRFLGQEGGEIYLGHANDCDDDGTPMPGTGERYCWTPTATRPATLDYANSGGPMDSTPNCLGFTDSEMMPPGDYNASDDWSALIGTPLNGNWTLSVTDLWPIDNGYIFDWSISFDPITVADCSSPLI